MVTAPLAIWLVPTALSAIWSEPIASSAMSLEVASTAVALTCVVYADLLPEKSTARRWKYRVC